MKKSGTKSFYKKHKKEIWIVSTLLVVTAISYVVYKNSKKTKLIPCVMKRNINKKLAGKIDIKSGVRYVMKDIRCENRIIKNFVGPEFEGIKVDLKITKEEAYKLFNGSDSKFYKGTMSLGIKRLGEELERDPSLATKFGLMVKDVISIKKGNIPVGKTMHHLPETSKNGTIMMQLVDKIVHNLAKHTGGSSTLNPDSSIPFI